MIPFQRKYLSFSDLQRKLGGRSRSSIYRDVEHGRLPEPIKIGVRSYWVEEEVDTVLDMHRGNDRDTL